MKQPSGKEAQKRPYQSPKLLVYGNVAQMTQATGRSGKPDGGSRSFRRRTGV